MTYRLTQGWPQRLSDGAFVNPETNQEYLAWLADGNTPTPYVAPVPNAAERIAAALADTETLPQLARKVEDLINHVVTSAPLDLTVEAWRADRATKRQNA